MLLSNKFKLLVVFLSLLFIVDGANISTLLMMAEKNIG